MLSARNEYDEALRLCGQALSEYPDNLVLLALRFSFKISATLFTTITSLFSRARLEEKIVGGEEALATARQMFQVHKIIHMKLRIM